jgi:hypothetical protein
MDYYRIDYYYYIVSEDGIFYGYLSINMDKLIEIKI